MELQIGVNVDLAREIAAASGSAQFRADVSAFGRYHAIGHPVKGYYLEGVSCVVGYFLADNSFRILGIGTREEEKGKGYASILLRFVEKDTERRGGRKVRTLTKVASEFYARRGYECVGINKRGEYIMEKELCKK